MYNVLCEKLSLQGSPDSHAYDAHGVKALVQGMNRSYMICMNFLDSHIFKYSLGAPELTCNSRQTILEKRKACNLAIVHCYRQ